MNNNTLFDILADIREITRINGKDLSINDAAAILAAVFGKDNFYTLGQDDYLCNEIVRLRTQRREQEHITWKQLQDK